VFVVAGVGCLSAHQIFSDRRSVSCGGVLVRVLACTVELQQGFFSSYGRLMMMRAHWEGLIM
jgi:hypothetical protein